MIFRTKPDMNCFIIVLVLFVILWINCENRFDEDIDDWEESHQIRNGSKNDRQYYYTKEELEVTKAMPSIDPKPCNDWHPISVFIHSAAASTGIYYDKRQALRNTWVRQFLSLNISVYFVIALNTEEKINKELKEESDRHKDMIQFSFIDSYYNLTLKAISILRWINKKCLTSTYILKADDDAMVNPPLLLDKLSDFRTGISGQINSIWVVRDTQSMIPFKCKQI